MLTGYYERGVSAAMTITNASSSFTGSKSGRTLKFTPQAVEKIKELVAQGVRRHLLKIGDQLATTWHTQSAPARRAR
jgi:hypothetical protein